MRGIISHKPRREEFIFHSFVYRTYHRTLQILKKDLGLGSRIYLASFGTAVIVASLFLLLIQTQNRASAVVTGMLEKNFHSMEAAREVKQAVLGHNNAIMNFLAFRSPRHLVEARKEKKKIMVNMEKLRLISRSPILKQRIRDLNENVNVYMGDASRLLTYSQRNDLPEDAGFFRAANWALDQELVRKELALVSAEGQERLSTIYALCDEILTINKIDLEKARADLQTLFESDFKVSLYGMALAGLFILVIGLGLVVSLKGSIATLLDGVRRVNDGDLAVELPIHDSGDLATLTNEFNRMARTIRTQQGKLRRQTITDELTGAYNQRHFRELLSIEQDRAKRQGKPFSLLMIDADHFKAYNDTYGHEMGNELIKRISNAVRENLRNLDHLARYGGDEFAALLPDAFHDEAIIIAERLVQAVEEMDYPGKKEMKIAPITLSIGGATFPADASTSADLVYRADDALYRAKKRGRNCVCWSSSGAKEEAGRKWANISFTQAGICLARKKGPFRKEKLSA